MDDDQFIVQENARDVLPESMDEAGNPTPEERANFVVERLAQFIRDGRTTDGMPFKQWQDMAKSEIVTTILDAQASVDKDDVVTKRLLFTFASALVTIGFWGASFAFDKVGYLITAVICTVAGIIMFSVAAEWRLRKVFKRRDARNRAETLHRVEKLNRRIRRMEKDLKDKAGHLERALKAVTATDRKLK